MKRRITILIAALGGQGGAVLAGWIARAARTKGFAVQSTSTPGVSQRTGATTYYLEIADPAAPGALALMPTAGEVDVLVCAELLEAARMLERGMCSPDRTTVVASTHRAYTTEEKMSPEDGRYDARRIVKAVEALSNRAALADLDAVRLRHRAAISAALFGALAGSGALPLTRDDCEAAIRDAGKGVAASLAAFDDAFSLAASGGSAAIAPAAPDIAREGAAQVAAYQDAAYAATYRERVERIARMPGCTDEVARETARYLALWMCYDDVIRVASHKARASRFARIRGEARAGEGDIVRVFDYFKPGIAEVADILPRRLGQWLARRQGAGGKGLVLQSSSLTGMLALRLLAGLRPLRRRSLRFAREQAGIEAWLVAVAAALNAKDAARALEVARLPRLRKGYGETHAAGDAAFQKALFPSLSGAAPPGAASSRR